MKGDPDEEKIVFRDCLCLEDDPSNPSSRSADPCCKCFNNFFAADFAS